MLPYSPDAGGKGLLEEQVAEQVPRVNSQSRRVGPFISPVEMAEKVAAVAPVEGEEAGRLAQHAQREAGPLASRQTARCQPRVRLDDVGRDQRVLEVEGGQLAIVREDGPQLPIAAALPLATRRAGAHTRLSHHRREVHVVHVARPVDHAGVEAELAAVFGIERRPQVEEPVDTEHCLGLGVGAVELDVFEGALGLCPPLLDPRRCLGPLASQGQRAQYPLGRRGQLDSPFELGLHAPPSGERPLGHDDRLVVLVPKRMLAEPLVGQVVDPAVAERVGRPGGDVEHAWTGGVGASGGDGEGGVDDEVDRDHVDHALWDARELAQEPTRVRDDHGLGHAEAPDPARGGLGEGGLDDRRPHDRDRHVPPRLQQRPLAEGLGERIRVGPAEGARPGSPELHEVVGHPLLAEPLGLAREQRRTRRSELAPRPACQLRQSFGLAALGIRVGPRPPGGGDLGLPVDVGRVGRVG